jgi:hypothetical protein
MPTRRCFSGRDAQISRGMDALRGMRATGVETLFVILGPSVVGKSSFLRAGRLPRLRRDHRNFVVADIVRPERAAVTGDHVLAQAIWRLRSQACPGAPALGDFKVACLNTDTTRVTTWLRESQRDAAGDSVTPTVVVPIDQGEELFSADAGPVSNACLTLLGALLQTGAIDEVPLIAVMTIRADRYQSLQAAHELLDVHTREFGELKPMPLTEYKDVITAPAERATAAGWRLDLEPALVSRLLADATGGADSVPLLALTLSRLYLDYGSTGQLTLANYEAVTSPTAGSRRLLLTRLAREGPVQPVAGCVRRVRLPGRDASIAGIRIPLGISGSPVPRAHRLRSGRTCAGGQAQSRYAQPLPL